MHLSSSTFKVNTAKAGDLIKMVARIRLDGGTSQMIAGMMAALTSGRGLEKHFEGAELRELQALGEQGRRARAERLDELQRIVESEANEPNM